MTEVKRKVMLLAHTQLTEKFKEQFDRYPMGEYENELDEMGVTDAKALALTAIRTCYSAGKPSEILLKEGKRYFGKKATDGGKGTDADRLIRMIHSSGHVSTMEHITFNFAVEGVSRALLAQLTRHRVGFSFSVQSQRYVKFGSNDRSCGFDYIMPDTVTDEKSYTDDFDLYNTAPDLFRSAMEFAQFYYDELRKCGVPAEDARAVLPQAAACNITLSINLRALLDFYSKRKEGRGAQAEIAGLAEDLKTAVIEVEPWLADLFEVV